MRAVHEHDQWRGQGHQDDSDDHDDGRPALGQARLPDPPRASEPVGGPDPGAGADVAQQLTVHQHRLHRARGALHARRERIRADVHRNRVYRAVVGAAGTFVVVLGLALVPLPGPGWLVVFMGLAVLGSEFSSARRVNLFARRQVHRWGQWITRRSPATRAGLGVATAVLVGAVAWGYLAWQGVPTWSPEVVTAQLTRLPGL